ncbi:uncharacterized protein [Diadema setosum]|uniref:uncharacterized protein n=1 Tax=Diadema setosum TaxID=31175 RepID=UPI003B3A87E0
MTIDFQVTFETPSVKLVGEPSPMDGLVVMESNSHMCYFDFNLRAADLVCRELGFPAAKDYSADAISGPAISDKTQWFSYSKGCHKARLQDCLSKRAECPCNRTVRLRCREPGFLGCYRGDRLTFQAFNVSGFNVQSDGECVSTCRRKPGNHDIAIVNEMNCICYRSVKYANFISGMRYTHYWTSETSVESEPGQQVHCLFNLSVGFCKHPGPVCGGYWDSDITSFGSKMTLTCDEGFMLNGSATLQCLGLPGWSTYFPVWNASVPSCRAIKNATKDNECQDVEISTSTSKTMGGTANEIYQAAEEWTTFQETLATSFPGGLIS